MILFLTVYGMQNNLSSSGGALMSNGVGASQGKHSFFSFFLYLVYAEQF